jgi:tetratricopeptide (TPR) repeat protein/transcriptional regulator with XRE-family HTH domain
VTGSRAESDAGGEPFGDALRAHRVRARLSQEQLAERAALTSRTVSNIERGRVRRPQRKSVRLLAQALGLDPAERAAFEAAAREGYWSGLGPPPAPSPRTLPPDVADFVGRDRLRDAIRGVALGEARPGVVPVCVIAGMAGVGKTALAVHAAHWLAPSFPDGQLFVPLHGCEPRPVDPGTALARLLTLLGEDPGELPPDLDARAELFRSRLSGRRVLLVLDDAAGEAQVRPLIPAAPGCAVLVTSRPRLAGLEFAQPVDLDVFTDGEAVALLGAVAGQDRIRDQRAEAARLAELCGRLPLAVRIVGARLAARPSWPLRRIVDLLSDERRRLAELAVGDLRVEASIRLSYRGLAAEDRRAFRLLGLLEAPDFAGWVAAAVLDQPPDRSAAVVERLVDARLLGTRSDHSGQTRYQYHQLVRLYARHRCEVEDPPPARRAAVARALAGWLALAEHAGSSVPSLSLGVGTGTAVRRPVDRDAAQVAAGDPLGWLDAELPALTASVRQAAQAGLTDLAGDLAWSIVGYFSVRSLAEEWAATAGEVLAAARRAGDHRNQAAAMLALAELHIERSRSAEAGEALAAALDLARAHGHPRIEGRALVDLGILERSRGELPGARRAYEAGLAVLDRCGDRLGVAWALSDLAVVCQVDGDDEAALDYLDRALATFRAQHDPRGAAKTLLRLGALLARRDDPAGAEARLGEALALSRQIADRRGQNEALYRLGILAHERGDRAAAVALLTRAARGSREIADARGAAYASDRLGDVCAELGHTERARRALRAALRYYRRSGDHGREAPARRRLAALGSAAGRS